MTALRGGFGALVMTPGPLLSSAGARQRVGMGKSLCRLLLAIWFTFAIAVVGLMAISLALSQLETLVR
jgi:hypothetical protein